MSEALVDHGLGVDGFGLDSVVEGRQSFLEIRMGRRYSGDDACFRAATERVLKEAC